MRLSLVIVGVAVGAFAALQELDGVGQGGQDGLQVLADGLGAAGQVDDEGGAADAGDGPREHGVGRDLQAGGAHGLGQAGGLAVDDVAGGLGGHVAGGKAGAAGGQHQVQARLVGPGREGGGDDVALVGDDGLLLDGGAQFVRRRVRGSRGR